MRILVHLSVVSVDCPLSTPPKRDTRLCQTNGSQEDVIVDLGVVKDVFDDGRDSYTEKK